MKVRPELANMSTDDLIRMVLQLEKKTAVTSTPAVEEVSVSPVETAMNPPVEEQPVQVNENSTAAEKVAAAQQAIAQAQASETTEEAPKKRRVSKKKSSTEETTEEAVVETPVEPVVEAPAEVPVETAPLNNVDPFSANTSGFNLFDQPASEAPAEVPMPMFEEEQAF